MIDDEAREVLEKRLDVVNLMLYQRAWEKAQVAARNSLAGRLCSKSLLARVQKIVNNP